MDDAAFIQQLCDAIPSYAPGTLSIKFRRPPSGEFLCCTCDMSAIVDVVIRRQGLPTRVRGLCSDSYKHIERLDQPRRVTIRPDLVARKASLLHDIHCSLSLARSPAPCIWCHQMTRNFASPLGQFAIWVTWPVCRLSHVDEYVEKVTQEYIKMTTHKILLVHAAGLYWDICRMIYCMCMPTDFRQIAADSIDIMA